MNQSGTLIQNIMDSLVTKPHPRPYMEVSQQCLLVFSVHVQNDLPDAQLHLTCNPSARDDTSTITSIPSEKSVAVLSD